MGALWEHDGNAMGAPGECAGGVYGGGVRDAKNFEGRGEKNVAIENG